MTRNQVCVSSQFQHMLRSETKLQCDLQVFPVKATGQEHTQSWCGNPAWLCHPHSPSTLSTRGGSRQRTMGVEKAILKIQEEREEGGDPFFQGQPISQDINDGFCKRIQSLKLDDLRQGSANLFGRGPDGKQTLSASGAIQCPWQPLNSVKAKVPGTWYREGGGLCSHKTLLTTTGRGQLPQAIVCPPLI